MSKTLTFGQSRFSTEMARLPFTLVAVPLVAVADLLIRWQDRIAAREALAGFGDHLREDIGMDRTAIADETGKPFWVA